MSSPQKNNFPSIDTIINAGNRQSLSGFSTVSADFVQDTSVGKILKFTGVLDSQSARENVIYPINICFDTDGEFSQYRFFLNGYTTFSECRSYALDEKEARVRLKAVATQLKNIAIDRDYRKGSFVSSLFGVLLDLRTNKSLFIGFLETSDCYSCVRTNINRKQIQLRAGVQVEGKLAANESAECLVYLSEEESGKAMSDYMEQVARHNQIELKEKFPSGYCTWYQYYNRITEAKYLSDLEEAGKWIKHEPLFESFLLDDGYCRVGDWLKPGKHFPSGLQAIAEMTARQGLLPGIWLAPFLAMGNSELLKQHPEFILRDAQGRKVVGLYNPLFWGRFTYAYALDVTHPGVQAYLAEVFRTLYAFGFRLFKLDFLYAGSLPGVRHNNDITSMQAIRAAFELIKTETKDAYLLGCGCPLEAGMGIFDGMRIGTDVTPFWALPRVLGSWTNLAGTRHSIRNTLSRSFMNGVLFHNDADCLILGATGRLKQKEVNLHAQATILSAGYTMFSADMKQLTASSKDLIRQTITLQQQARAGKAMPPAGVFEQEMAHEQVIETDHGQIRGVYNFGEQPMPVTGMGEAQKIFPQGAMSETLAPHSACVLKYPQSDPQAQERLETLRHALLEGELSGKSRSFDLATIKAAGRERMKASK